MQLFSDQCQPSFGVGALSTVDEDLVFLAKQLPISVARNRTQNTRGWNSAQRSLTIETTQTGEWAYEDRFDFRPYSGGEVGRLHENGTLDVYELATKRLLSPREVEDRWFNMADSA